MVTGGLSQPFHFYHFSYPTHLILFKKLNGSGGAITKNSHIGPFNYYFYLF